MIMAAPKCQILLILKQTEIREFNRVTHGHKNHTSLYGAEIKMAWYLEIAAFEV